MNIDFIKWLVGYAEGFEYEYHAEGHDFIKLPNGKVYDINSIYKDPIIWPLLFQKAFEGINRDLNNPFSICTEQNNIEVYHHKLGMIDGWVNTDIDQAKEQALKSIYEQEAK